MIEGAARNGGDSIWKTVRASSVRTPTQGQEGSVGSGAVDQGA